MSKSRNQKLKILYLYNILKRHTDQDHGITMRQILKNLQSYDIKAERKTIYEDIALLRDVYGADIGVTRSAGDSSYRLLSRDFELPELKLLVDAVQSSKFITQKKTDELIQKLESLASVHEARGLQGQVYVHGRIKTMNETIYYNVDAVNEGIVQNRMISFRYFEWTSDCKKRLRRNGALYTASPLALSWDNENYYLIALDANEHQIRHYRVDKMLDICCTDRPREGMEGCDGFDTAVYSKSLFGMFGGRKEKVTLSCKNVLAGAVIDRFGADIMTFSNGDSFTFTVNVQVSPQFFAWLCGLCDKIKIISPSDVRQEFKDYIYKIYSNYDINKTG